MHVDCLSGVLFSNIFCPATLKAKPLQDATEGERLLRLIRILSVSLSLRLSISLNEAANKSRASLQLHCMEGMREKERQRDRKVLIMHTQQYSTVAERHRAGGGGSERERARERGLERTVPFCCSKILTLCISLFFSSLLSIIVVKNPGSDLLAFMESILSIFLSFCSYPVSVCLPTLPFLLLSSPLPPIPSHPSLSNSALRNHNSPRTTLESSITYFSLFYYITPSFS